jgi:DIS3-like exonuclease 2
LNENNHVVLLRGIPFNSTEQDIVNFFGEEFSFVDRGILIPRTADGQSSGQAYVKFSESEDVKKALKKNKQCMDTRYIEIFDGKSVLNKFIPPRTRSQSSFVKDNGREFTINQIKEAFSSSWRKYAQKTGRVVAIREAKHSRSAVGHLTDRPGDERFALFKPTDSRVPRMLISKANCPPGFWERQQDFENVLFIAKIMKWEKIKFAFGDLTHAIGDDSSVENCTTGILIENEIKTDEFTQAVLESLPHLPFVIPPDEISSRKDLRKECIFTIDPLTARDLDDAVSIEKLDDGNFRVGVHIADVSYFVNEHTELDKEAQERATSVYLVQKVVPMLPRQLCENLCSLNPNQDRLTFTVEWRMTAKGEIIDVWFGRSVINSAVKLAYEHAQDMLDSPNKVWAKDELPDIRDPWDSRTISGKVNMLQSIAVNLRQEREESGALRLDQPKLCFSLDRQSGLPQGFKMYEHRHSNRLIEEFMLLANTSVAKKLYQSFPNLAVLRNHFPPKDKLMDQLIKNLEKYKIILDPSNSKRLQDSLNKYKAVPHKGNNPDDFNRQFRYQVLMNLLSKPMQNAKYFCSGYFLRKAEEDREENVVFDYHHHYALNVPLYTHFTSPIRRYPDILVHR